MIEWAGAAFLVVGFLVVVRLCGLVEKSKDVIGLAKLSAGVIRNKELSDEQKERELQSNAKRLFGHFLVLALGGAAAFGLPLGLVWVGDQLGLISLDAVLDVALSITFIIVSSIAAIAVLSMGGKRGPAESHADSYSKMDRVLHRLAFKTNAAQTALADFEDRAYAKQIASCSADRPVFITSLPRAGTTLLLECCAGLPGFASHCYRDMPFVLIPCLWNKYSGSFRQEGQRRERAHGDGMLIDFDSPEALEEVVWKTFWKKHYRSDRIEPWRDDEDDDEFTEYFRKHMRKIIYLRRGEASRGVRYISKNNLNITRTGVLRRLFPDSVILIPFRDPVHHAASLLQQHQNFLSIHKEDRFASEYMRAIGHFDFGENLRPVDFGGWMQKRGSTDPLTLAFWLEYWVAAFEYLLGRERDSLRFLSYETLCEDPQSGLRIMAETLGCDDPEVLLHAAADIRPARPREVDTSGVPVAVLGDVERVLSRLKGVSLNGCGLTERAVSSSS